MTDVLGMAFTRDGFKNKIQGYLTGALREFLSVKLGEAVGLAKGQYLSHWTNEVNRLLDIEMSSFFDMAELKTSSKYEAKLKAYEEAKKHIVQHQHTALQRAMTHVKSVCEKLGIVPKIHRSKYQPDEWYVEFWKQADAAIRPPSTIPIVDDEE